MKPVEEFGPDLEMVRPAVGERFPDVTLRSQWGESIRLSQHRGDRRALVVFIRSAHW